MFPELADKLRASSVEVRSGNRGCGSGVIWSADGAIVTNAHVVRSRNPIVRVREREFRAEIVRQDSERDIALLHIDAHSLPAAEIGDSSTLRPGQIVAAIGNPLGIVGSVSTGVIHATSERKWIQADVRLAPGNSGGMLADARGRVIGINTMIYGGLALAVPSNTAAAFVRGEAYDRPVLGIAMTAVTLKGEPALVITEIAAGGLADRSGLLIGDVLLYSARELHNALDAGGLLLLRILRANQVVQMTIPLPGGNVKASGAKAA